VPGARDESEDTGRGVAIGRFSAAENAIVGSPPEARLMLILCGSSYFYIKTIHLTPNHNKKLSFMSVALKSNLSYPETRS
jgi:hypothetical protein